MTEQDITYCSFVERAQGSVLIIDDHDRFTKYRFPPGGHVSTRSYHYFDGTEGIVIQLCSKDQSIAIVNDRPHQRYLEIPYVTNRSSSDYRPEVKWQTGRISVRMVPVPKKEDLVDELHRVAQAIDLSSTSTSKFRNAPPGQINSLTQLLSMIFTLDEKSIYPCGGSTRVHNLPVRLKQVKPGTYDLGVAICDGEWHEDLIRSYLQDKQTLDCYNAGVAFLLIKDDKFQIVAMASNGRTVPFIECKKCYPDAIFNKVEKRLGTIDVDTRYILADAAARILCNSVDLSALEPAQIEAEFQRILTWVQTRAGGEGIEF